MRKRILFCIVLGAFAVCAVAVAQQRRAVEEARFGSVEVMRTESHVMRPARTLVIPWHVNYQGYLTDDVGNPINDTLSMTFRIYTASAGGNELWNETQNVIVESGLFNVILGSITPIPSDVFGTGESRWLELTVGIQPLFPRTEITSVAYAYRSVKADSADYALDTDMVDGFDASLAPTANDLFPLSYGDAQYVNEGQADAVTSSMVLDGTLLRADVDAAFKAPYADTADYALDANVAYVDSAGVSANSWRLEANTLTDLDSRWVNEGQADAITSSMIVDGTILRGDADATFKAPYADTADYALAAPVASDGDWTITGNVLYPSADYGLAMRSSNVLYGTEDSTHVNLGIECTTGTSGQNYKYCTVGGGLWNTARGAYGTVGGGSNNTASYYATVSGGVLNTASANLATVGGGVSNTASNSYATVGGGSSNTASNSYATVGGGSSNTASNSYATVGGGRDNTADAIDATVGGGASNTASGPQTTVGGGANNSVAGGRATVGGGGNNTAGGSFATVGGGSSNTGSGSSATVGGGYWNTVSGWYATVAGGYADTVAGDYSFATGREVRIGAAGDYTFAFGRNFTTSTPNAVIFHNSSNEIKVGIGETAPANILTVQQTSATDPIADAWTIYSSKRWKTDIRPIPDALEKVKQLRGVYFDWRENGQHDVGMIAEEVGEVIPEVVAYEANGEDARSLDYARLVAVLIEAVKEQQDRIEALEAKTERMEETR